MSKKTKPLIVGLTGPTGSGKSTVASIFGDYGYRVIDADHLARAVVEKGSETLLKLCERFGDDILFDDGTLNRKRLSQIAFSTEENTQALNHITHPAIVQLVKATAQQYFESGCDHIVYDAPLLFESGSDSLCDCVISVIASKEIRTQRIQLRDKLSISDAQLRVNAQKPDSFYTEKSDYVIFNDSTTDALDSDARDVIEKINEVYHVTTI